MKLKLSLRTKVLLFDTRYRRKWFSTESTKINRVANDKSAMFSTMLSRFLCVLVMFLFVGETRGALCECRCCAGISCTIKDVGKTEVQSCNKCTMSVCQAAFSSSCVLINGQTQSSCQEYNASNTASAQYPYFIILMAMSVTAHLYSSI